jgi:hypothetical protein
MPRAPTITAPPLPPGATIEVTTVLLPGRGTEDGT